MITNIKAYANCDNAVVVWQADKRIDGLRGFALYRKRNGVQETLDTWVGFTGENVPPGTFKPSTTWPVQKFLWTDYLVKPDDTLQYQVVPMVGSKDNLQPAGDQASPWSEPITVTARSDSGTCAYFNRGIVASQWLSRRLDGAPGGGAAQKLDKIINTMGDPTRNMLAGELRVALLQFLSDAANNNADIYACLFELNDPELLKALQQLGVRAHVVLANGAAKGGPAPDENQAARNALKGVVDLHNRMVKTSEHLDHHKFVVLCDANAQPQAVWTGSTNWQVTGLCTQANNGILIVDPDVAALFRKQWDLVCMAGNDYPPDLLDADAQKKVITKDGRTITVWFAPMEGQQDLSDARGYIQQAKQGILFLMFNPGPAGTLLNDILDFCQQPANAHLYVHGVPESRPRHCQTSASALLRRCEQFRRRFQRGFAGSHRSADLFLARRVAQTPDCPCYGPQQGDRG